jgi:hypothetical protein
MISSNSYAKNTFLSFYLMLLLLLFGCSGMTQLVYTIPDNYEGFLVIEFSCVNGKSLNRTQGRVNISFNDQGYACVTESYDEVYPTGVSRVDFVTTRSGIRVSFEPYTRENRADYAITWASLSIRRDAQAQITGVFEILWVGDLEKFHNMIINREYMNEEAAFFESVLGIPPDRSPRKIPTPSP